LCKLVNIFKSKKAGNGGLIVVLLLVGGFFFLEFTERIDVLPGFPSDGISDSKEVTAEKVGFPTLLVTDIFCGKIIVEPIVHDEGTEEEFITIALSPYIKPVSFGQRVDNPSLRDGSVTFPAGKSECNDGITLSASEITNAYNNNEIICGVTITSSLHCVREPTNEEKLMFSTATP